MKMYKLANTSKDSFIEILENKLDNTLIICMGRKNLLIRKKITYNNKDLDELLNEIRISIRNGLSSFEWIDSFHIFSIRLFKDFDHEYYFSACINQFEENLCVTLKIDKDCLGSLLDYSVENDTSNDYADWGKPRLIINSNYIDIKKDIWNANYQVYGETFKFMETRSMSLEFDRIPFIEGLHELLYHRQNFVFQFCNTAFHLNFIRENKSLYKVYIDYSIDCTSSYIESSLSLSVEDIKCLYNSLKN